MNGNQAASQRSFRPNTVAEMDLSKARRAIEYFLFSCSNTLREPLKTLTHVCATIRDNSNDNDEASVRYIAEIQQAVSKMETVLNDLQQFLSYSHNAIAVKSINTELLVLDILTVFQVAIMRGQIQLNVVVDQPVPFYTDLNSFRMILTQLISNAVKFADHGKSRKELSVMIGITKSDCRVSVTDNGVGIDPSIVSEIFNLFFKASPETIGSGVGLFIVNELVHTLGGEIRLKSVPGGGSEFYFETENLWAPGA